jgi:diguanylate cyclase (GGDEF)-like protein
MHDPLTGLYNRGYFDEEMKRLDNGRNFPVSIIMADLDGLKKVNDTHGHGAGDRLIRDAADILRRSVRSSDVVARMGGDEFAVILPNTDIASAQKVIERIRRMEEEFNGESDGYQVRFSMGAASSVDGVPLAETLKRADELMYRDKSARKGGRSANQ